MALVKDILKRIPAQLLGVSSRPMEACSTSIGGVGAVILPKSHVAADMLPEV
jgi:hypothetical protein